MANEIGWQLLTSRESHFPRPVIDYFIILRNYSLRLLIIKIDPNNRVLISSCNVTFNVTSNTITIDSKSAPLIIAIYS